MDSISTFKATTRIRYPRELAADVVPELRRAVEGYAVGCRGIVDFPRANAPPLDTRDGRKVKALQFTATFSGEDAGEDGEDGCAAVLRATFGLARTAVDHFFFLAQQTKREAPYKVSFDFNGNEAGAA